MTYEEIMQSDLDTCLARLAQVRAGLKQPNPRRERLDLEHERMFLKGRIQEISTSGALQLESELVWLDDISKYDYVRVIEQTVMSRVGLPKTRHIGYRTVGYTNLRAEARSSRFRLLTKRVFFVKSHDRSEQPDGVYKTGCPIEAVDPRTLAPGIEGVVTDRAWGKVTEALVGTTSP